MSERRARVALPVVLPDVPDLRDGCVRRLENLVMQKRGITKAHAVAGRNGDGELCLHYDPEVVTLAQVERLAKAAGARISERFGHEILAIHAIGGEDAARRIEADLKAIDGILEASVNLAAQRVRIEYERERVSMPEVVRALERLGYPPVPPGAAKSEDRATWSRRNRELMLSLAGGALLAVAWAGSLWFGLGPTIALGLYATSYVFGAWDLMGHWLAHARKGKVTFDIDLLMLLAAVGAAVLGEWAEGAFLLFLF